MPWRSLPEPQTFAVGGDPRRDVVVAAKGAYTGKPRPAVVVQAELFNPTHSSVSVCPITSDCVDAPLFRITLPPGERTGLTTVSQVMVDKDRQCAQGGDRPRNWPLRCNPSGAHR